MSLTLTYAGFNYLDRTLALQLGELQPKGITLRYVTLPEVGALFRRMAQFAEFDAAEMSLSTLMLMAGRGDRRLVALPVFPSRSFRHGFLFVRADSPLRTPADLAGMRVGVQDYQATAYLWIRALLEHEYGVPPSAMTWVVGGLDVPNPAERLRHAAPPGVEIVSAPGNRTLEDMLQDGELDAVLTPERLHTLRRGPAHLRRLIPDHADAEREYYARTGHFPIMHVVALRRDVYEANPWIATSLVDAFEAAKRAGMERLRRASAPALTLPWLEDALAEVDELFGGDPFPIGFEANRPILEQMAAYSHEQGLSEQLLRPEDIFAPETIGHTPADVSGSVAA
jgi:4,5-dihydroxyphthalate decarboxylase